MIDAAYLLYVLMSILEMMIIAY